MHSFIKNMKYNLLNIVSHIFPIGILSCPTLYALDILHQPDGQLILKTDSCEELKHHIAAISKWGLSRGETPHPVTISCEFTPDLKSMEISKLLPVSVKRIYNKFPVCEYSEVAYDELGFCHGIQLGLGNTKPGSTCVPLIEHCFAGLKFTDEKYFSS